MLGAGEKVTSDLGLCGGFRQVLRFPAPATTAWSRLSQNMAEKVTKNEIPNSPDLTQLFTTTYN